MAAIIFAVIFVVIGMIVCMAMYGYEHTEFDYSREKKVTYPLRKFSVYAMVLAIFLAAFTVAGSCVVKVPTGHTGVLTTFGRVENRTIDAGISMKAPWQKVVKMDNRVQKVTVDLKCFSADLQEVTIRYTINYRINKANAQELYKTVGKNYYDTVVAPNISEAIKEKAAYYTAEQLVASRSELALGVEELLSNRLAKHNVDLDSAAIEDMDFTDAFTNAVEAKQVAAQNKLQAEIEQEQKIMEQEAAAKMSVISAEAEAEVARIQAEADLAVSKIQADAAEYAGQKEAAANEAISKSISEDLIRYYYIQQWDGVLPGTYVGSEDVSTIIAGTN